LYAGNSSGSRIASNASASPVVGGWASSARSRISIFTHIRRKIWAKKLVPGDRGQPLPHNQAPTLVVGSSSGNSGAAATGP
jgi:hypothetical protein